MKDGYFGSNSLSFQSKEKRQCDIKMEVQYFNNSIHIFLNVKVTLNKNLHKFRNHFLARFFMAFHTAQFILLVVLALKQTQ